MSKLKNLLPEELLGEEERTSEWQRQNIRDMNAIIRSVNDLEKKIKDVDKELDKMENLWFSRRDTTWPHPLENLFLKGARFGSENVSLETVRFNLKSFKKWLEEVQSSAADLLKDIAKKK